MTYTVNTILDLEKKYMNLLYSIFSSYDFEYEVKKIETYVSKNYEQINNLYDKKNKVDIAIERLIRYFIYTKLKNIQRPYASPISCDMAIEMDDCILNIDSKTIDSVGNLSDSNYFHFESNQSSFEHDNFGVIKDVSNRIIYTGIPVRSNLPSVDPFVKKPLLTFFLKVIYSDNGKSFSLYNGANNISLTCLPNGILSSLFNKNIVFNFKTFTYNADTYLIGPKNYLDSKGINFYNSYSDPQKFLDELKLIGFEIPFPYQNIGLIKGRPVIISNGLAFVPVKRGTGSNTKYFLESILHGHTARILYPTLTDRLDSKGIKWYGHLDWKI